MLNQAIAEGVEESAELDWKRQLPERSDLKKSDIDKDIAAMANSGGGIIVYGVLETDKRASSRHDAGTLDERYQQSLRQIAFSSITPPVLDLRVHAVSTVVPRAYAIEVPASNDGPHLIFNNQYFGAPFRNDADTMWMGQRQLESSYRTRFDEHRFATAAIEKLYEDAAYGRTMESAWLIAVARPRVLPHHRENHVGEVHALLDDAERLTLCPCGEPVRVGESPCVSGWVG
jgi:predicted HTH transcriptional regulator